MNGWFEEIKTQIEQLVSVEECWCGLSKKLKKLGFVTLVLSWRQRTFVSFSEAACVPEIIISRPLLMINHTEVAGQSIHMIFGAGGDDRDEFIGSQRDVLARIVRLIHEKFLELSNPPSSAASLTSRELQCLQLVAGGNTSKEIASKLGISTPGVNFHILNVSQKLGARNRTQAVALAISLGLIRFKRFDGQLIST